MEIPNSKCHYDGVKFYGLHDLGNSRQLEKTATFFATFSTDRKYENINEIIELYNIQQLIDSGIILENWTHEQYQNYKEIVCTFTPIIGKFFSQISNENFLRIVATVSFLYMDDFWALFVRFKVFEKISAVAFEKYLSLPNTILYKILKHKSLVNHYGTQLANAMRMSNQTIEILVSQYLKETKADYFIPKELGPEEFEGIFLRYIESEQANPNVLQLIYKGQSTKECPISDKLRLKSKRALEHFWRNHKENIRSTEYGVSVRFLEQCNIIESRKEGAIWQLTYDIGWFEDNLDYPTLLNNFTYLFGMFDLSFRSLLVSVKSQISAVEDVFTPRGAKFYPKGVRFNMGDMVSTAQTALYYDFLRSHNIDLEDVFKWFFETYLPEEFGVCGFYMTVSSPVASYVERCRSLASEMDGILKQFRMFVQNGEVDRELFEMSSEHMLIGNVPSLVLNKYVYPNSQEIESEMRMLFSDQTALSYIEKTKSKYDTFFQLLEHEKVSLFDFAEWQQKDIQWLNARGCVSISPDSSIELNRDEVWLLNDLYEHGVTCMHTALFPSVIEKRIASGDLRADSRLFTEPERDYLNYMLNQAEFSDGLDLRNKYIHSTYPKNEKEQRRDYIALLKLMVLIITKMNDEFCIMDYQKRRLS